jgi:protein-tyrosine phosphatase
MTDLFNFRDLAGLPTTCERKIRPGLLFRTGNISHIGDETGAKLTRELNIGRYIDFRTETEIKAFGRPEALIKSGVEWINLHIDTQDKMFNDSRRPNVPDWVGLYTRLFEKNLKEWVHFLNIILETKTALVYGCVFGKDRTGIATSFLLTTLDVHEEHIHSDYARTTENMVPHFYDRFLAFFDNSDLTKAEQYKHYMIAHPEIIRDFVGYIRARDEDIFKMLQSAGWSHEKREALKSKLLF